MKYKLATSALVTGISLLLILHLFGTAPKITRFIFIPTFTVGCDLMLNNILKPALNVSNPDGFFPPT
jgi:hypothetical protein